MQTAKKQMAIDADKMGLSEGESQCMSPLAIGRSGLAASGGYACCFLAHVGETRGACHKTAKRGSCLSTGLYNSRRGDDPEISVIYSGV